MSQPCFTPGQPGEAARIFALPEPCNLTRNMGQDSAFSPLSIHTELSLAEAERRKKGQNIPEMFFFFLSLSTVRGVGKSLPLDLISESLRIRNLLVRKH